MKYFSYLLMIILCSSFVFAISLNFSDTQTFSKNVYEVLDYNYYCIADNSTYNSSLVYNQTFNFTHTFNTTVDNINKTYNVYLSKITKDFIILNFQSDFILPEKVKFEYFNNSYLFWLKDDDYVYIPLRRTEGDVNWTLLINDSFNSSINYSVVDLNESRLVDFNLHIDNDIKLVHIKGEPEVKVKDLLLEKIIVISDIPIKNINITADKEIEVRTMIGIDEILIYLTPLQTGPYKIKYNVTDLFGNSKIIESDLIVNPIDTVFFYSLNIPSLAVGERSKLLIYDAPVNVPINYTLMEINFEIDNSTLYNNSNSTKVDLYFSDETENSYFLEENKTVTINKLKTYLNIMPLNYGKLILKFKVDVPPELNSNQDFIIRASIGNYSIFDKQEFNIAGVKAICELNDVTDLINTTRKCYSEFPINNNIGNSLIILQERDFNEYQNSQIQELEWQEEHFTNIIKKRENWLMIFIVFTIILLLSTIWLIIPKDWIVIRVKNEN